MKNNVVLIRRPKRSLLWS